MSFDGNLQPTTDSGYDLANKGSIHTHDSSDNVGIAVSGNNGYVLSENSATSTGLEWIDGTHANPTQSLIVACSDASTALTVQTGASTFRMPYGFTLTAVRASLTTPPTGSVVTVDINEAGSTILSTKITIDVSELTSVTAAAQPVISDSSLADDAEITIDIDTIGSTDAGSGLKVYLIGSRT